VSTTNLRHERKKLITLNNIFFNLYAGPKLAHFDKLKREPSRNPAGPEKPRPIYNSAVQIVKVTNIIKNINSTL